jgi:putative tryptophan/tyrosine transport system substrate-binding protein
MKRRDFIVVLGAAAASSIAARAQQATRSIGVLFGYAENDPTAQTELAAFRNGLAKLGWKEDGNLRIELRWGAGDPGKIASMARELVERHPDLILGQTTPVAAALARETKTIPVVFITVADPIASGFVATLARPGGNVTGFSLFEAELGGKWVELLKQIAPRTARIALLFNPATAPPLNIYMSSIQTAASSFGIRVADAPFQTNAEIERAIEAQAGDGGLIVMPNSSNTINRELITTLAARYGVPAIYYHRFFTESGGLISYGDDRTQLARDAAGYVDRILRGAKPEDLPVQAPTKYDLVINLKSAKALALDVPSSLLTAADEVIE